MTLPYEQQAVIEFSRHLANSFERATGGALIASPLAELPERLYKAPFVIVAHDTALDPVFCYANLEAQKLWNMPWRKFITTPSRLSAEEAEQEERDHLLQEAKDQPFIDNYAGVRITADGKRFRIEGALLWNVTGDKGKPLGQAATFEHWEFL